MHFSWASFFLGVLLAWTIPMALIVLFSGASIRRPHDPPRTPESWPEEDE